MHKKIIYIVLFFSFCTVFNSCGSEDNSPSDQTNSGDNINNDSGYMVQILKGNDNSWSEWKRLEQPETMTTLNQPWFKSIVYDVNGDCILDIVLENDKLNAQSYTSFNAIRGLYYEQQQNGEFEIKYKQ